MDVFHYAQENTEFSHESTGDQWFSESQFESYRMLGFHVMEYLCTTDPLTGSSEAADGILANLQRRVRAHVKRFAQKETMPMPGRAQRLAAVRPSEISHTKTNGSGV